MNKTIAVIKKREGDIVPFDQNKITQAILKAGQATGEFGEEKARELSQKTVEMLQNLYSEREKPVHVEEVQDVVEVILIKEGLASAAKAYILYRNERARLRQRYRATPPRVQELVKKSKEYFRNPLSEFIYYRTYSRWIEEEGRRETWIETVQRYIDFMRENLGDTLANQEYLEIQQAILKQEVMPSMRLLWSAGKAARKTNVCAYNCSYIAPSRLEDFAEIMYLLMCGAGVGFSVESQTAQQLPIIKHQTGKKRGMHVIEDSKEGWGDALTAGLKAWYAGEDINFDFSKVRPAGARLRTMGGRSSGPEPLRSLLSFCKETILKRQGKRLKNIDVHDIICKIGEIVVMGGVRRSALISLSDLDDEEMRNAKVGRFYITDPHRSLANNSAVYIEKPSADEFLKEWLALIKSGTGERGIFNRGGLQFQMPERRWKLLEPFAAFAGSNPCGEIILRSKEFCNLTEVVARPEDTEESLIRKTRIAAIIGTYQATLTHFPYLSPEWRQNCSEERLLGVSITGQWDSPAVRNAETLRKMKQTAIEVNQEYAKRFGINSSAAITCVKPSGTVSQLVDASAGMHPRYGKYYLRRIRISASDPLFHMLKEQGFPYHPEVGQNKETATTYVLEFPVKAPAKNTVYRNDLSAIKQLEYWKLLKENFTEHNPSVTISVGPTEWIEVANWLYKHWEIIGGLSFLPREEHVYQLAPYEEITEKKYNELTAKMPKIDFGQIMAYEHEDNTQGSKELACVSGSCEIDFIPTEEQLETVAENN